MPESIPEIIEKVDAMESDTSALRTRMDADYDRWLLKQFNESVVTGKDSGSGFKQYTSNEPRVYARKALGMVNSSVMNIHTRQGSDNKEERARDNAKERFFIGGMQANDSRLAMSTGQANALRSDLTFYAGLRGYTFTRALVLGADEKRKLPARLDARTFDPRYCMWEMGSDGLIWFCRKFTMTMPQIQKDFGGMTGLQSKKQHVVYDYWNRTYNGVFIDESMVMKEMGYHPEWEQETVPIIFGASNVQPLIRTDSSNKGDEWLHYGESIFAENRQTWDVYQHLESILWELVARGRKPVIILKSKTGLKTLDMDPFIEGSELALAEGDELIVVDLQKAAADTSALMAIISGENQRGSFSSIMYGDSPLAISGFAMNTLRSSVSEKVVPVADHEAMVLTQVSNKWVDQFVSGQAGQDGIQLSGIGSNREWFSEKITPDDLRDLPELEITLTPQMPEDNVQNVQMAVQLAQAGADGLPMMSHLRILEKVLQVQDSDLELDTVIFEKSKVGHPLAAIYTLYVSAVAREDEIYAAIYEQELLRMEAQIVAGGGQEPGFLSNMLQIGPSAPGFSPQAAPNSVQGQPPPSPGDQQGAVVPPGTPRPGARNGSTP